MSRQRSAPWWDDWTLTHSLRIPRASADRRTGGNQVIASQPLYPPPPPSAPPGAPPHQPGRLPRQPPTPERSATEHDIASLISNASIYSGSLSTVGSVVSKNENNEENDSVVLEDKGERRCHRLILLILVLVLAIILVGIVVYLIVVAIPSYKENEDLKKLVEDLQNQILENQEKIEDIENNVNISQTNPCIPDPCIHGECQTSENRPDSYFCVCTEDWAGPQCDMVFNTSATSTTINIEWAAQVDEVNDQNWVVRFGESEDFPDTLTVQTSENSTSLDKVKRLITYNVVVSKVSWDYREGVVLDETRRVGFDEDILYLDWPHETSDAELGYVVRASRLEMARSGKLVLPLQMTSVVISALHPCTSYWVELGVLATGGERTLYTTVIDTENCGQELGWRAGYSVIVSGWIGGGQFEPLFFVDHCDQPDNFPPPVVNPSCPLNQDDGRVGEAIVDHISHSGSQSWHYKRGSRPGSSSEGAYTPELQWKTGRRDGEFSGLTKIADGFSAQFWIRPADESGDDSYIEMAGASSVANDRRGTIVRVYNYDTGLEFVVYDVSLSENCISWGNCSAYISRITLASGLSQNSWHKVDLTMRSLGGDYGDRWNITVDDQHKATINAWLEAYYQDYDLGYFHINRIKFQTRHQHDNITYQGYYIDDVQYKAFEWSSPGDVLDFYATSFEYFQ